MLYCIQVLIWYLGLHCIYWYTGISEGRQRRTMKINSVHNLMWKNTLSLWQRGSYKSVDTLVLSFRTFKYLATTDKQQTHPECFSLQCIHTFVASCRRKTTVKTLCIYADYKSDESYTPSKISVRVGNNFHNLQEIRVGQWCFAFHLETVLSH